MIGYITLGTNDISRAAAYYDELLGLLGAKRIWDNDRLIAWGNSPKGPAFGIVKPFNGEKATVGNGTMISLAVKSNELVDQVHAKALALGGTDEGATGPRGDGSFYLGYFRDLDGNKVAVYCFTPPQ